VPKRKNDPASQGDAGLTKEKTMKSHVGMEQKVCPVCGQAFDTGVILLDKRLRNSLERKTVTGWDLYL